MVEKNAMERMLKRMEKNVKPGCAGSSGSELKFISDFQKELNNQLLDKDTKICSLEEDLKFINPYLEHFGDVVERHLWTKNPQSYFYF